MFALKIKMKDCFRLTKLTYRTEIEKTAVNPVRELLNSSLTACADSGLELPVALCCNNRRLKSAVFSNGVNQRNLQAYFPVFSLEHFLITGYKHNFNTSEAP